nr:nucleoside deaminase [Nonlabens ulvanivorans]
MKDFNINHINKALALARDCLSDNKRHPFGAVVVRNDAIVGIGKEGTFLNSDPTAHSEIEAIRSACTNLKTSSLKNCVLYTSSEPCSMCLSATFWAGIKTIYYACSRDDVYEFGFSDKFELVEKRAHLTTTNSEKIRLFQVNKDEGIQIFNDWKLRQRKIG